MKNKAELASINKSILIKHFQAIYQIFRPIVLLKINYNTTVKYTQEDKKSIEQIAFFICRRCKIKKYKLYLTFS